MGGDTTAPVVFVGNATEDSVFFVEDLPTNDEVAAASKNVRCLGGRGVVPALVARALGIPSELCTVMGADCRSRFNAFLSANGVGLSGVKWDDRNAGVTQYVAFVSPSTGTTAAIAHRPALDWRTVQSQRDLVASARAVYFSTNDLSFNRDLLSCLAGTVPVLHNLGIRLSEDIGYADLMINKSTVIIGNRVEMARFSRLTGLMPDAMFARSSSLRHVIVTAGREEVQVYSQGATAPVAYPVQRVDSIRSPVGAGDSFAVGILWAELSTLGIEGGVRLGLKLSALAVQSERSYPDLRAVSEVLC